MILNLTLVFPSVLVPQEDARTKYGRISRRKFPKFQSHLLGNTLVQCARMPELYMPFLKVIKKNEFLWTPRRVINEQS